MMLKTALRNLGRQSRRSLLLGSAVAFAVAVTLLASFFSGGMLAAVQANLSLSLGGHLAVSGNVRSRSGRLQARMLDEGGGLEAAVRAAVPGLVSVGRRVSTTALLVFGGRETRQRLSGVDWAADALYSRELRLVEGSFEALREPRSVLLDSDSLERLGASLDDEILARFTTASGQHNVVPYRIAAVYDSRSASPQTGALAAFGELRSDLNMGEGEFQSLVLTLDDLAGAPEAARLLESALAPSWELAGSPDREGLRITTVMDLMGELTTILATVRWLSAIVFTVMLALTAAGITNTFRMVLIERTREIGTMRCLGMQRPEVLGLMVLEAELITFCGAFIGLLAAWGSGALIALVPLGLEGTASLVLRQGRVLMVPDPGAMAATIAAVLAMGAAASLPAAWKAASLVPAVALRKAN
jgi:putative ABC transport system permease protein